MQLSIIIIHFNTPQLTIDCLHSIYKYTEGLEFEIILVDNAPKQEYKALFLREFPDLVYIVSINNIGFGKANNLGMEVATGSYFLLLNNDTLLQDNALLSCFNYMEQSPQTGMLGCKLLNEDLSYQASFYPFTRYNFWNFCISNNPILHKLFNVTSVYAPSDDIRRVGDVSGAFMFLQKEVFESTKGFDPDFFLYCEETEWCRNRIAKYYHIVYYPKAAIIHLGGKSAPKEAMYIQSQLSLGLFWYKTGWLNYIGFLIFTCLNALFFIAMLPFSKKENQISAKAYLNSISKALPYWLKEIPRYGRQFAARKEALFYKGAREIFFS